MPLNHFLSINLPYCLQRTTQGWVCLNREYMPLGWHLEEISLDISKYPIGTNYPKLSESRLEQLAWGEEGVKWDKDGRIESVFLYNDALNPGLNKANWDRYARKLELLSSFEAR